MRKLLAAALFLFLFNSLSFSQTLTSDGDYDVSATNYPGFVRAGVVDVHSPTGVVVTVYHEADANGQGVFCKIYNEQMGVLVSQFQVNTSTANSQLHAQVKVHQTDNTFIVLWASNHDATQNYDVYMRKYDLYGNALSIETKVNDAHTGAQFVPQADFDYNRNELVVIYRDENGQDGAGIGVFAKRINYSNLSSIGTQFRVNQSTTANQTPTHLAISQVTGDLIVAYHSNHAGNYDQYKAVASYNSSTGLYDTPVETKINSSTNGDQNNGFIKINQTTGEYVIAWNDGYNEGSGFGVYSEVCNSSHTVIKSDFIVNSTTALNQLAPRILWIESVNQIIYYFHYSGGGTATIKYRLFSGDSAGNFDPVGNEADAIGGVNVYNNYYGAHFSAYYNSYDNKIFLSYDIFNSNWAYDSKVKLRKFTFSHPDLNPTVTTLTPGTDYDISANNFPGFIRGGMLDIHNGSGKVVTVFHDPDADGQGVFCQIYDESMNLIVNKFQVNVSTNSSQVHARVKINQEENSFVVAWASFQNGHYDVYIRKFDLFGNAQTGEMLVNDANSGAQHSPVIALDYARSEVLIVYRDDAGQDLGPGGNTGAFAKRLNYSDLTGIGNQILINHSIIIGNQTPQDAAINQLTGDLIVIYHSNNQTPNSYDVYRSVLTYNGGTGNYNTPVELRVNNYYSGDQVNESITINQTTGDYIITWTSAGGDGSGYAVFAKIYDSGHNLVKNEFRVNSNPATYQVMPKVVWLEDVDNLLFIFHQHSSTSTLKYRLFDGNIKPGDYIPINNDSDAIGGQNTAVAWGSSFLGVYVNQDQPKLYLIYDVFNSFVYDSKTKLRIFNIDHVGVETCEESIGNYIYITSYDEYGSKIGQVKNHADKFGRITQQQYKNVAEDKILATETLYGLFGSADLVTLPAPTEQNCFSFDDNFITNNSSHYSVWDFDHLNLNNPVAVNSSSSLGNYYSINSFEEYNPVSSYPYYRSFSNYIVPGGVTRTASAGEALKMGSGHEKKSVVLPLLNELDNHYLALKNTHFISSSATSLAYQGTKLLTVDENGVESFVFSDKEGKVLATCQGGGTTPAAISGNIGPVVSYYNITAATQHSISDIQIHSYEDIVIYNTSGTILYSGPAHLNTVTTVAAGVSYQIRSYSPFNLTYLDTDNTTSQSIFKRGKSTDYNGRGTLDIYVKDFSSVSLSGGTNKNIKVTDLLSGSVLYNGAASSFSNSSLNGSSGFIRFQIQTVSYYSDYSTSHLTINYSFNYLDFAYNYYDLAGRIIATVAPKGVDLSNTTDYPKFTSKSTFNSYGAVITDETPDQGRTEFLYRKDGTLRYVQNEQQRVTGTFTYYNYDVSGRVVESGQYDKGLGTLVFESYASYTGSDPNSVHTILDTDLPGPRYDRNNTLYDVKDLAIPVSRTQRFLDGKISRTSNTDRNNSLMSTTWYSYDERGRVEWMVQNIYGLGVKTVDYVYENGQLKDLILEKDNVSERVQYTYTYDNSLNLKSAYIKIGNGPLKKQAEYFYYLHGPLKRVELAEDLQGIDYYYTINGWLKGINHPELTTAKDPGHDGAVGSAFAEDVFGMTLDYYNNDYSSSALTSGTIGNMGGYAQQYLANIRSMTWQTKGQGISGNPCQYSFNYDEKYQLTSSYFGHRDIISNSFIIDPASNYFQSAQFDKNGNIDFFNTNKGAAGTDGGTYKYGKLLTPEYNNPTTNQLYVLVGSGIQTYDYDKIGQLTLDKDPSGNEKRLTYDSRGLVMEIRDQSNTLKVSFAYDESGNRIRKTNHTGTSPLNTYYVYDFSGNLISVYDDKSTTMLQSEIPIYGTSKIGTVYRNASVTTFTYDLYDQLGNVRATVLGDKDVNGDAVIDFWADYFPFGEINLERRSITSTIVMERNDFQGQFSEKDTETGWNSFDLRMYNARIGRWLSVDPYNQFFSPYIGMGNNPVNAVDPDGGFIEPPPFQGGLFSEVAKGIGPDEDKWFVWNPIYGNGGYWTTLDGSSYTMDGVSGNLNPVFISNKSQPKPFELILRPPELYFNVLLKHTIEIPKVGKFVVPSVGYSISTNENQYINPQASYLSVNTGKFSEIRYAPFLGKEAIGENANLRILAGPKIGIGPVEAKAQLDIGLVKNGNSYGGGRGVLDIYLGQKYGVKNSVEVSAGFRRDWTWQLLLNPIFLSNPYY